jgi:hypothetical protein
MTPTFMMNQGLGIARSNPVGNGPEPEQDCEIWKERNRGGTPKAYAGFEKSQNAGKGAEKRPRATKPAAFEKSEEPFSAC